MNWTQLRIIGRVIYALPLLVFGVLHFISAEKLSNMLPPWIPGGSVWIYLTGIALLISALGILFNRWVRWSTLILGILLLSFALFIHLPGALDADKALAEVSTGMLLKDAAMAGAAFYICSHYWE